MRPSIDETWLAVAHVLARRSTCLKMQVGCVLADARGNELAMGYNGVAHGMFHCNEDSHACAGASAPPGADLCEAVHAEQNALTKCRAPELIWTCYTTVSPCMRCVKQLLNTYCGRIVFAREYTREPQARALWERAGREWILLETTA